MTQPQPAMETVALLGKVALFKDLKKDALEVLAAQVRPVSFPGGHIVIKDNDPVDGLYIIKSGMVKVTKSGGRSAAYEAVLALLRQGDSFGEIGLIDGLPRSANVTAMSPIECYFLGRDDFLAALEQNPRIALALFPTLANMVRNANQWVAQLL